MASQNFDQQRLKDLEEIQTYINTPKLQSLLAWAERITYTSETNIKPVGKRAIALANANAYTLDSFLKDFIKYVEEVKKIKVYNKIDFNKLVEKLEKLEKLQERPTEKPIIQTVLEAFQLKPEMIDLSEEEINSLENYFSQGKRISNAIDRQVVALEWERVVRLRAT